MRSAIPSESTPVSAPVATPSRYRASPRTPRPPVHCASMRCTGPSPCNCSDRTPSNLTVAANSREAATASPKVSRIDARYSRCRVNERQAASRCTRCPRIGYCSNMKRCKQSRSCISSATTQLELEQFVELRRIRLAFRCLHHLPDEETEQFVLAGAVIGELLGVGGDHRIDHPFNGAGVRDLLETLRLDDVVRGPPLGPHRLEYFLGDLARDGLIDDSRQQAAQLPWRHA